MPLLPEDYGLASLERFSRSQIWDVFYYPSWQERGSRPLSETYAEESAVAVRHHIKRQCAMLHIGEGTAEPARDRLIRENPQAIRDLLERHRDRLLGVARCTVGDVNRALGVIDEWIVHGPMVGVCFPSIGPGALECNDPKFDPIVRQLTEAGAIIVQLCNFVAGKKTVPTTPRRSSWPNWPRGIRRLLLSAVTPGATGRRGFEPCGRIPIFSSKPRASIPLRVLLRWQSRSWGWKECFSAAICRAGRWAPNFPRFSAPPFPTVKRNSSSAAICGGCWRRFSGVRGWRNEADLIGVGA